MRTLAPRFFASTSLQPTGEDRKYLRGLNESDVIGHSILQADRRAYSIPDSVFDRLDVVLEEVRNEVQVGTVSRVDEARGVLRQIEQVLIRLNFTCSMPRLVETFADGLIEHVIDMRLADSPENSNRRSHMLGHPTDLYSVLDCDLGSLLYLSIAEVLSLPLSMVEVPGHNFVRWVLDENSHLDWDTNYGFDKYADVDYVRNHGVTPEQIVNHIYLSNMSTENVKGYFDFLRGLSFEKVAQIPEALAEYRSAVQHYPRSPTPMNNIAWLYVSNVSAQAIITSAEALSFAERACALVRSDSNLDTLACTYAQSGDFATAITIESEAYALSPSPSYQQMIAAFGQHQTWLDAHP